MTEEIKQVEETTTEEVAAETVVEAEENVDKTVEKGILKLEADGIIEKGDKFVVTGGNKILPMQKESQVIGGILKI